MDERKEKRIVIIADYDLGNSKNDIKGDMMSLSQKTGFPEPRYLIDPSGKKSHVILTLNEYNKLIRLLKDSGISNIESFEKQETPPVGRVSLKGKKAIDFYGILKSDHPDYVKQIAEDKDVYYDL